MADASVSQQRSWVSLLWIVLGWAAAAFSALFCVVAITDRQIGGAIAFFAAALLLSPPLSKRIRYRSIIPRYTPAVVAFCLFFAGAYTLPDVKPDTSPAPLPPPPVPQVQTTSPIDTYDPSAALASFNAANADGQQAYSDNRNALQIRSLRETRDKRVMARGGWFRDWPAILTHVSEDSISNNSAGVIVRPDGCDCTITTVNGTPPDGTEFPVGSSLYKTVYGLKEGDHILISGHLLQEGSLTNEGSLRDPEWWAKFSDIQRVD